MLPENGFYDLEDYETMIQESQFQGLTTNEYVMAMTFSRLVTYIC